MDQTSTRTGDTVVYARQVNDMCHYATDEELDWMMEWGREKRVQHDAFVVMLGAGPGVLLLALKEHNRHLQATVVDVQRTTYVEQYLEDMGANEFNSVEFIVGDSIRVGREWVGRKVDLLIVDTDHTEATTELEIETWLPHVFEDGVIFFHDYDASGTWFEKQEQYPGVKAAVDRLMVEHTFVGRVGTAAIYRKAVSVE